MLDNSELKRCSKGDKCINSKGLNGWLEKSEFVKRKVSKDGLNYECKICVNAYKNKHYQEIGKYKKQYRQSVIGKFRNIATEANRRHNSKITYKHLICLFVSSYGICPITNTKLSFKNMHLDHIKSIHTGGTNDYDNLVFLKDVANTGKNGYGLNKFLYSLGDLCPKDYKNLVWSRINHIHNRYEFTIDEFLEMTDEQLELTVNAILKSTNLLNT